MEKFTLQSKQIVGDDSTINVVLFPNHYYLNDKIAVNIVLDNKMDIQSQIDEAILEYTEILFNQVQEMENIPDFIKQNIEL